MNFDYFYEEQSESYAFYKIPKVLFTEEMFEGLTTDAKVLYGLLLDRVSLSKKNGWIDESGKGIWTRESRQVSSTELKSMLEAYKDRDRGSVLSDLSAKKAEGHAPAAPKSPKKQDQSR